MSVVTAGSAVKLKKSLLGCMWSSIENLPTEQQEQAHSFIRKIEKFPNLGISHRFEMVYEDMPQHGTNIIQLLLDHMGDHQPLEILPGQDLFENIAAFKEKLLYKPNVNSELTTTRHLGPAAQCVSFTLASHVRHPGHSPIVMHSRNPGTKRQPYVEGDGKY